MQKITMSKVSTPTIEEAFELFLRKCRVKNLTELSIESYKKKMVHFNEFLDGETNLSSITSDTIDDYILWLRENTEANDITINSYLRSVRAFLYYCMTPESMWTMERLRVRCLIMLAVILYMTIWESILTL